MYGLSYFGDWDVDSALARMAAPAAAEKPQAAHPFSTPHDGGHGWGGPVTKKKGDKKKKAAKRAARRRNRK